MPVFPKVAVAFYFLVPPARTDDILPVIKKCRQSGIIVTAGKPPIIITKFNAATAIGMLGGRNDFRIETALSAAIRPRPNRSLGRWRGSRGSALPIPSASGPIQCAIPRSLLRCAIAFKSSASTFQNACLESAIRKAFRSSLLPRSGLDLKVVTIAQTALPSGHSL